MEKKRFFTGIGVCLIITMSLCLWYAEAITATECQSVKVIKVFERLEKPAIDPETLVISSGDCVVWYNADNVQVKVRFMSDRQACSGLSGFFYDEGETCFTSFWHGPGKTVSLQLPKEGIYEYAISRKEDPTSETTGKIEVRSSQ